jgi:hypothetical protein
VPERAGQLAQHRVGDHHRRQLPAGQHVAADRDVSVQKCSRIRSSKPS